MLLPTDTAMATTDTPMPMDTTTARGLLMPSPLLMLMPTTVTLLWLLMPLLCPPSTVVLSTVLPRSMAVSTATTMARGPLMPSPLLPLLPKLMPMPTTAMVFSTTATATVLPTTATATTDTPTCTTD